MYLKQIDLQGFKTFAKKTTLHFLPPKKDHFPLTAIVGPNGSGKSNLSDAIRWTLGEQSLKLLRGKDTTDVIFSGSDGKGRAGFAEVTMTFDNTDGIFPLEASEIAVTRRLYRDGESDYLVCGRKTRLQDIHLMLAEAGVGQRSYSVIGQGMIDQVLASTPEERKLFFDDATGVRPLQIKRHQAMLKLKRAYENLAETEMVLEEIEPRLRLLSRQAKRLEERTAVELTLKERQTKYYQSLWFELADELAGAKKKCDEAEARAKQARKEMEELDKHVSSMEEAERAQGTQDSELSALNKRLRVTEETRRTMRDEEFRIQKEIELARVRTQDNWSPLPVGEIVAELESIVKEEETTTLFSRIKKLIKKLKRPEAKDVKADPKLEADLKGVRTKLADLDNIVKKLDQAIEDHSKVQSDKRTELFVIERKLREEQRALHTIEESGNLLRIELARLEERRENLHRDIDHALKEEAEILRKRRPKEIEELSQAQAETHRQEIEKLKYKLELIGGIDPEIVAEFEETQTRFSFLETQAEDLRTAMKDAERLIDELDERIHKQSEKAFHAINKEFQKYFKVLFGGGSCSLVKMTQEETDAAGHDEESAHEGDVSETLATADPNALSELKKRVKERRDRVVGIEIQATPPGKKLKALNLLSGGERALASIALLAAIMATNPAPFVVLDEVDAALDEANTVRFASILSELRKNTQYIVITHNRATMEKADVLYGVTMNDDGVSQMLSVKMEEVTEGATSRR